jgi:hypothetical protein
MSQSTGAPPNHQGRSVGGVSQHLEQTYGISIRPGDKGLCPFCRGDKTFSVKKDDTLGKCFHPGCGRYVTLASLAAGYTGSLSQVLDRVVDDFHKHLVEQGEKKITGGAWDFLRRERGAHPRVLRDLKELGAVPAGYDVDAAFAPALDDIERREKELVAKIEESLARRLEAKEVRAEDHKAGKQKAPADAKSKTEHEKGWEKELLRLRDERQGLQTHRGVLGDVVGRAAHWISLAHTDPHHRVLSMRFRQAFQKHFMSYLAGKSGNTGLFGHALFQPFSESKGHQNRLIIVEGELNLLSIQSLVVRTSPPGQDGGGYANWVAATGSATTVDTKTIAGLLATPGAVPPPVVIQDNDDAGDGMVEALRQAFAVEVVRPPTPGHDIEDHLRQFKGDDSAALESLAALLRSAVLMTRDFAAVAADIYSERQKWSKDDLRREHEIHAAVKDILLKDMLTRGVLYHQQQQGYFFYRECKRLIALDGHDMELSCFLDNYGLNAVERCYAYQAEALHVEAITEGTATDVHRLCWFNPKTHTLYLFNHENGIYKVTPDTVTLLDNGADGVLFLRDRRNEPFKVLDEEINEDLFHEHITAEINFAKDGRLTVADLQLLFFLWFLSTFFASLVPTKAILAFIGPKGSGKSYTLRKIGLLLFGSRFQVQNLPEKVSDFDAVVTNGHLACFDNADAKVDWLADRLAVCATGGDISKRILYTTNTRIDYPVNCFIGITSRTPYFTRDDVADRTLVMHVERLENFASEGQLKRAILSQRDRIMTVLVRQLQDAIRALRDTEGRDYPSPFRMADFAAFALRLADARGGREAVEGIFARMSDEQAAFALEGDSLVDALLLWLQDQGNHGRLVDAATLHRELAGVAEREKVHFGYRSGRSLGQRLGNVVHNLRKMVGVEVVFDPHKRQKMYRFRPLQATQATGGK